MADDPNRDLLPVKEGCRQVCGPQKLKPTNTMSIPSYSTFGEDSKDLQQRHYVTKLDRDELEDRFLRMMEDHTQMKKKCNSQEEKIKRLATKLLRIVSDRDRALKSASDRRDHHALDRLDEMQARINDLENCNQQLQERVVVLKTQLGTHSKLHASVHYNAASQSPSRSGCRSRPCSRTGLGSEQDTMIKRGCDSWDQQGESKGFADEETLKRKVKHLEQELASLQEQHRTKIMQLEQQVSYLTAEEQRHRAADNIEMIRLKREMKTQAMQMEAVKANSNESELELERVRCELKDCQSNNCQLEQELHVVKTSNLDLMEQLVDAKGKSEHSRDLINQMSDLQREHESLKSQNSQLLEIASKTICSDECAGEQEYNDGDNGSLEEAGYYVEEEDSPEDQGYPQGNNSRSSGQVRKGGSCEEECLGDQGYPRGNNSRSSGQVRKGGSCEEECLGDQGYPQGNNSRSSGQVRKGGSCEEECLGDQGYPQGNNSRSSGQVKKGGSYEEDRLGDQGYPRGNNSRSSGHVQVVGPCEEDCQDEYNEVQRIRDKSASQECFDPSCPANDPDNTGVCPAGQSDFDENEFLERSSTSEIEGKDSHTRAHNRLCTCDVQSRKSFYPPCNCGCTLCTNAQLSKNGVSPSMTPSRSMTTNGVTTFRTNRLRPRPGLGKSPRGPPTKVVRK